MFFAAVCFQAAFFVNVKEVAMAINLLSGRKNVVKHSSGNTPVRVEDATERVAKMMGMNHTATVVRKKSGCKSCGGK